MAALPTTYEETHAMQFNFNTDQDAMAALYTHLTVALANHGATSILVPLSDAIAEAAKAHNLSAPEKTQLCKSLCDELASLLRGSLG